jgi:hypothetical protein
VITYDVGCRVECRNIVKKGMATRNKNYNKNEIRREAGIRLAWRCAKGRIYKSLYKSLMDAFT